MKKEIPDGLVAATRHWLGTKGIELFREYKQTHGTVSPVFKVAGMPWAVHFREGMAVRNFMRKSAFCGDDWTAHDYDDSWQQLIEECIK